MTAPTPAPAIDWRARYDALRAALEAELTESGAVTRDEVRTVLDAHPPADALEPDPEVPSTDEGAFADGSFSPDFD